MEVLCTALREAHKRGHSVSANMHKRGTFSSAFSLLLYFLHVSLELAGQSANPTLHKRSYSRYHLVRDTLSEK